MPGYVPAFSSTRSSKPAALVTPSVPRAARPSCSRSSESRYARRLLQGAIQKGSPAPDVAFTALEDSTRRYRVADFRGRYLLLDFWAVWCGPCVAEMRHLHAAEAKYAEQGLAILSVSLDRKPETVARFRAGKWRMPWLHGHAREGIASRKLRAFEIVGIPRPVLLDPAGTIAALDDELRGSNLDATLARFLGGASGGPGGGKK
jgi:thiol-disulfide isomerase/thioredoxin